MDIPVYVLMSDKYGHLIGAWDKLTAKYWPKQAITFLGYQEPDYELPERFKFISIGTSQEGECWADGLRPFFESERAGEEFIILVDDLIVQDEVLTEDLERLAKLVQTGLRGQEVSKAMLHACMNTRSMELDKDLRLVNQSATYRTTLHPAVWKRSYFLNWLKPGYSAWDFELKNMPESMRDGAVILALNKQRNIMSVVNVYKKGRLAFQEDVPLLEEDKQLILDTIK